MKFNLKRFDDLGKCSYATLKDEYDTDKDIIYLDEKPQEIKTIDDLFKFIWRCPGIAFTDRTTGKSAAHFWGPNDAWYKDYYSSSGDLVKRLDEQRALVEQRLREDNAEV